MRALADPAAFQKAAGGARRAARLRHILNSCVFKASGEAAGGGGGAGAGASRRARTGPGSCVIPALTLHPAARHPPAPIPNPQILPMENVKGRALVEGGKLCERKNGRGVDTNRSAGGRGNGGARVAGPPPAARAPGASALALTNG
jgi:hypothetical protein